MKRLSLKNTPQENIQIFGICSTEKMYKLCWEMNQVLDFQFVNVDSHRVYSKDNCFEHILYEFIDLEKGIRYYLIQNKTLHNTLDKQHKIIDYFLVSISELENNQFEKIKKTCKGLSAVRVVIDVDYQKLKQKDNFYIME